MKIVFVKQIDDGIRVVKRYDKRTGQSEYHLQSLHFNKWRTHGTINQFENVAV